VPVGAAGKLAAVPDVVIIGDTFRVPELRHEVPVGIPDEFVYIEAGGRRHVVLAAMELPVVTGSGEYELHALEEFGADELRRTSRSHLELIDGVALNALRALGVREAVVPGGFPLLTADKLRAAGIELTPDRDLFVERRRRKNGHELAGIRRAQAAAEAGMTVARDLLRQAEPDRAGELHVDGRPLAVAEVKAAISSAFIEHGASSDVFVVSHGPQSAIGHHLGDGHLRAGEPVIVDLWPRDNKSACCADMTRTFVVGDVPDEIREWHRLCVEALEAAIDRARPGEPGRNLYAGVCDVFEGYGQRTLRTKPEGETLAEGFFHTLGHGVGLEVHEAPSLGPMGAAPLVAGDVLALEPGLYRPGLGGVRVEDLVLVGEDGPEVLTSFPRALEP
jgi:Xaa-Pro aminopeptidase